MMMKKKAVILTFHTVDNYGAVLQSFALQEKLKEYFETVKIVDYRPKYLTEQYKAINTYSLASILHSFYSMPSFLEKKSKFSEFRKKHLNLSHKIYYNLSDMADIDTDFIFVGSDQIWNPTITNGFDPVYFGNIPNRGNTKTVSYAASIGQILPESSDINQFFNLVKNIDSISVRESDTLSFLQSHTNNATLVLDPTLLIDKLYWNRFVQAQNTASDYVLIYNLTGAPELANMAKAVAKSKNMKIIEINGRRKGLQSSDHKTLYSASPEQFVNLIANAGFVITDSFHGTAFSVIFEKNFAVLPHKTRGGRMKTLLSSLGIENRIRDSVDNAFINESIDYSSVTEKLNKLQNQSISFIEHSIERSFNQYE